ncbi:glycine cleavage system aminomethyltransferase GcvT [Dactylosporangium sp. NPDC051484]|uniref:glycine cleavage system aminomethyltransferase GcvT n=1 Tax=Dactylosporangium sp. NPDC051484 TaxID=3154942 RepID=UPI00344B071F
MSKQTPLHDIHAELGASFTDFAGWSMPLRYTSELAEHHAVRTSAGIFDLTHMGEIELSGPEAGRALDHALVGQPSKIAVGRARYSMLVHETGGVLDDLVVYRLAEDRYLIVANASNAVIVFSCLRDRIDGYAATIRDASDEWALLAVQGPNSAAIIGELADVDVPSLKYYSVDPARLAERDVLLARTGYTGEDGFEVYCRPQDAAALWRAISAAGARHALVPCGLACRDTLRLEAGMPLYGQELTVRTTPFEAGLGRVVAFGKPGGFVGEAALAARRDEGPARVLVGLTSTGRRAPRTGYAVLDPDTGERIGEITSGALSPTLGHPVAMAYLPPDRNEPGTEVLVDIRGSKQQATVVQLPFYRRQA